MGIRSWDSAASTTDHNAMEVNPGISVQEHNYTYMFNFEQDFEHLAVRGWMEEHWRPVCCWASGVYMLLVVGGQAYMAERSPFQLRGLLTAWNIFLHWYHHVTVLIYCWYSFTEYTAPARWFVVMNFVVHSIMYSYYALRAMRFRPPKAVAMLITSLQLLQMVVGCTVNFLAYRYKTDGRECRVSDTNLKLSLLMYISYFVLFARFFHNAYFQNKKMDQNGTRKVVEQSKMKEMNNFKEEEEKKEKIQ